MANSNNLQDIITNVFGHLTNNSLKTYKPIFDSMLNNINNLGQTVSNIDYSKVKIPTLSNNEDCNCCPPKNECPPKCIASISRCATSGERIIIPFIVKNTCSQVKTYRIGVRELMNEDGKLAPSQPILNKHTVTLQPGRSERVLMEINLEEFESGGATYITEIVLREKNINQNICFTLKVNEDCDVVTTEPQDEKKYLMRWQSWQSHYYCQPKASKVITPVVVIGK